LLLKKNVILELLHAGLTLEKATDIKFLQKKYETLDRQVKEISNSLRTRYLPKTHQIKLKETLESKVAYRDQLQWQSQVNYMVFFCKEPDLYFYLV
jgi:hypothetical protein